MENFCRGAAWGLVAGVVIGGIIVAKNKKLASKIKEGLSCAETKIEEVKDTIADKLQENDCCMSDDFSKQNNPRAQAKK